MRTTCLVDENIRYSEKRPFDAAESFPEIAAHVRSILGDNPIQGALRRIFREAGLDAPHFGTAEWNPLGEWIRRGQRVVIKPNWVLQPRSGDQCLITHGAFVRAVLDYVVVALRGSGTITVCDAPIQSADFGAILCTTGLEDVATAIRRPGIDVSIVDLRREVAEVDATGCKILGYRRLAGDPAGYVTVDLGPRSYLDELCRELRDVSFHSPHYESHLTNESHRLGTHRYLVARSVLDADVFINLPKMKTHKKAGLTGAMKNLVGINGAKEHIVHFRKDASGSDEFGRRSLASRAAAFIDVKLRNRLPNWAWAGLYSGWKHYKSLMLKRTIDGHAVNESLLSFGGSWHGNMTIWRMIYDLNTILLYADSHGTLSEGSKRKAIVIVDGIVAGEGDGPLRPSPRQDGIIAFGDDPLAVDTCLARLMGFDPERVPTLSQAHKQVPPFVFSRYSGEDPFVIGNPERIRPFAPPPTWKGHVERQSGRVLVDAARSRSW